MFAGNDAHPRPLESCLDEIGYLSDGLLSRLQNCFSELDALAGKIIQLDSHLLSICFLGVPYVPQQLHQFIRLRLVSSSSTFEASFKCGLLYAPLGPRLSNCPGIEHGDPPAQVVADVADLSGRTMHVDLRLSGMPSLKVQHRQGHAARGKSQTTRDHNVPRLVAR